MKFIRLSQNVKYLTSIGLSLEIAESILPILLSMDKVQKGFYLSKIKKNIGLLNSSSQLLGDPNYLKSLFPFEDKRVEYHPLVAQLFNDLSERDWVQGLVRSGDIIPEEDCPKVLNLIENLKLIKDHPSLSYFKDDKELYTYVTKNSKYEEFSLPLKGYTILGSDNVEGNSIQLLSVNRDGIAEIGAGTNWCVARGHKYNPDVYFCFLINGTPEVLAHGESDQIKDRSDAPLKNYFIKLIDPLVKKFHINTHEDDFEIYDRALQKIDELSSNLENREFLESEIKNDVNVISLFPLEIVDDYLPLVIKNFSGLILDNLYLPIMEKLARYINIYNLPERIKLDSYVFDIIREDSSRYLKLTTPSLRTKGSNDAYNNKDFLINGKTADLSEDGKQFITNKLTNVIRGNSEIPYFTINFASSKLYDGTAPESWLEGISKNIRIYGYPPDFASDWASEMLDSGRAPEEWGKGIISNFVSSGRLATFAIPWARKQLDSNNPTFAKVISEQIKSRGWIEDFASGWAKKKLDSGDFPKEWIDGIVDCYINGGSAGGFADEFLRKKIKEGDPLFTDLASKRIILRGEPPYFANDWAKEKIDSGDFPKKWINGITIYLMSTHHMPGFSLDWVKNQLDKDEILPDWEKVINEIINVTGSPPSFANDWAKRKLNSGSAPKEWIKRIYEKIGKSGEPPYYASGWAKYLLDSGRAPESWTIGIERFMTKGYPPDFASDWAKKRLENGDLPQHLIKKTLDFVKEHHFIPDFANDWYVKLYGKVPTPQGTGEITSSSYKIIKVSNKHKIIKLAENFGYGCWISPDGSVNNVQPYEHNVLALEIVHTLYPELFDDNLNNYGLTGRDKLYATYVGEFQSSNYPQYDELLSRGWVKVNYSPLNIAYSGELSTDAKRTVFSIINNDDNDEVYVYNGVSSTIGTVTRIDARRFINGGL